MNDKSATLELSLQVGKYDVQKLLGKGATGTVYLARDTFIGKLEPLPPSQLRRDLPEALDQMSLGAQLQLMRALVRNVSDRLALANTRIAK